MSARGLAENTLEPGMPVLIYSRWYPEGRPGTIVKVGRTRVHVAYDGGFRDDGSPFHIAGQGEIVRAGEAAHFLTLAQVAEKARRDAATRVLRAHGIGPLDPFRNGRVEGAVCRFDELSTETVEALAGVLAPDGWETP